MDQAGWNLFKHSMLGNWWNQPGSIEMALELDWIGLNKIVNDDGAVGYNETLIL